MKISPLHGRGGGVGYPESGRTPKATPSTPPKEGIFLEAIMKTRWMTWGLLLFFLCSMAGFSQSNTEKKESKKSPAKQEASHKGSAKQKVSQKSSAKQEGIGEGAKD